MIRDAWLSEAAGKNCVLITSSELTLLTVSDLEDSAFYTCRVNGSGNELHNQLTTLGFRHVLNEVEYMGYPQFNIPSESEFEIRSAIKSDFEDVVELAASGFSYDRFHWDPQVNPVTANQIKKLWVSSAFRHGSNRRLWIAEQSGRIAGFCLTVGSLPTIRIDLIAVDVNYRNRGVGARLVSSIPHCYGETSIILRAGTQVKNRESLRLYERVGMKIESERRVYHRGAI